MTHFSETPNNFSKLNFNDRGISTFQFRAAFEDMVQSARLWKIWLALSWQEFQNQYRRTVIGIAWVMISFLFFIFVKLIIFKSLLSTPDQLKYSAFLVVGFYIWRLIISSVNAAPDTFSSAAGWIRSENLPLLVYVYKNIMREFYNAALTLIVVFLAFWYLGFKVSWVALYSIPAFIFILINAVWVKVVLGVIATRYRDISFLVKTFTMPLMFLTPIFWMPEQMADLMKYIWWNPFYHYIEIFRAPFVERSFPTESWKFVLILFAIGSTIAVVLFARFRQRIAFWL